MKTTFLLAVMLISTASFAGVKKDTAKKAATKVMQPRGVIMINLDHLRSETKDVSMLKPVFAIMDVCERTAEKLHGKTFKLTVTNALLTTTNVQ